MKNEIKGLLNTVYTICDNLEQITSWNNRTKISDIVKMELTRFGTYISRADGIITQEEADVIAYYIEFKNKAPLHINNLIRDFDTNCKGFEKKVPYSFQLFVMADNMFINLGKTIDTPISKVLFGIYDIMAKTVALADGEINAQENEAMKIYSSMLEKYLTDNLLTMQTKIDSVSDTGSTNITPANETCSETLDNLLKQLNSLIGLNAVKKDVSSLIHLQELKRIRKERGLKEIPTSNHLVFFGNPGTGKTTVARLLAKIYFHMGILPTDKFIETDRSKLVGGYVGQTAIKTKEVIDSALGGILFIDEAYTLSNNTLGNDYGQEAIEILLKAMEDNRDNLIVIVAGYPELMKQFINSNPGLKSRFNKFIEFEDYNPQELMLIYKKMCSEAGYINTDDALTFVQNFLTQKYENRNENFANAREVRNLLERAMLKQADRLFGISDLTDEQICQLELFDVS